MMDTLVTLGAFGFLMNLLKSKLLGVLLDGDFGLINEILGDKLDIFSFVKDTAMLFMKFT
jgi:hypothetical protein